MSKFQNKNSKFIVSLDFELYWGVQDHLTIQEYKDNLDGVWVAIPKLLDMFNYYGIHATWATVGFLFAENYEDLKKYLPVETERPTYAKKELSPYRWFEFIQSNPQFEKYFFAPDLIRKISQAPGQEIASHTFSHYYCMEEGQTIEQFQADLKAAKTIAEDKGYGLQSLVFPRNQSRKEYLKVLKFVGIEAYRSESRNWIHTHIKATRLRRALRLLDVYLPLTGGNAYTEDVEAGIFNFTGSSMYKPYFKKLYFLESFKLLRIKHQMKNAARKGLIYHLWWHPHNIGIHTKFHMKQLEKIFAYYKKLQNKYGMESVNMEEAKTFFEYYKNE